MTGKVNKAAVLKYSDISVGSSYSFERTVSCQEGQDFAKLTGDFSPLHVDSVFGKRSQFKKNVAHGMLLASFFSTIVGMYCPGKKNLYISQTANFRGPIFYGDIVQVKGTVIEKSDSIRLITLKMEVFKDDEIALTGEARVKVLE